MNCESCSTGVQTPSRGFRFSPMAVRSVTITTTPGAIASENRRRSCAAESSADQFDGSEHVRNFPAAAGTLPARHLRRSAIHATACEWHSAAKRASKQGAKVLPLHERGESAETKRNSRKNATRAPLSIFVLHCGTRCATMGNLAPACAQQRRRYLLTALLRCP